MLPSLHPLPTWEVEIRTKHKEGERVAAYPETADVKVLYLLLWTAGLSVSGGSGLCCYFCRRGQDLGVSPPSRRGALLSFRHVLCCPDSWKLKCMVESVVGAMLVFFHGRNTK